MTFTLDARQAVLAAPTIAGRQTANRGTEISAERYAANGGALGYSIADGWRDGSGGHSGRPVAITPTGRVTTGTFTGSTQALLEDTALPSPATDTDGTPLAPDAFHLLFVHQQQIPALLDYDLTAEDVASRMARARITTAATPAAAQDQDGQPGIDERWFGRHPALGLTVTFPLHVRGPVRRDHYLLTGQGITWQPLIEAALPDFDFLSLAGPVYTLRGGQRVQRTFFQQPLRPTVTTGTTPATRSPSPLAAPPTGWRSTPATPPSPGRQPPGPAGSSPPHHQHPASRRSRC